MLQVAPRALTLSWWWTSWPRRVSLCTWLAVNPVLTPAAHSTWQWLIWRVVNTCRLQMLLCLPRWGGHGDVIIRDRFPHKGAVTCAVCPGSAWLVTFLIGNVSTGVVTWSALRCGASGESGKKVAAAPLSKTAAAAAAAKTWFAKHPLDYMLHNRFPWKRSGRRSSMWPPYSLRRNLSAAACRPCDRSLTVPLWWESNSCMEALSMSSTLVDSNEGNPHTSHITYFNPLRAIFFRGI